MSAQRRGRDVPRLNLLHVEPDLVVVNKPAGLLTIPTAPGRGDHEDTLMGRAREYARHKRGRQAYVGMLHRLDRGTSGALAIALSPAVHTEGRAMFRGHHFERTYLAIVEGVPAKDEGTIDLPISAEHRDGRRGVADDEDEAMTARTYYRVRERFGDRAALVEVTLDTGRQHQIRVHMSAIGHPLVGDRVYGRARDSARPGDRPLLHAWRLAFPHPLTGQRIAVEAPLPR
ncbi:MAG: RluA family pseudouridine synthase, partial [Acidobacteria bacterium]|nr:RluA family pseudouridine synthase [Acidobacteriota bacterium]